MLGLERMEELIPQLEASASLRLGPELPLEATMGPERKTHGDTNF